MSKTRPTEQGLSAILDTYKTICVYGDRNTGKSNTALSLLYGYTGKREIYLFGYPEDTPAGKTFKHLSMLSDLVGLRDAIVLFDELHKHIKFYNKKSSHELLDLLAMAAHNNITIVFTTCLSQYITVAIDTFIDAYIVTQIRDKSTLKRNGKLTQLIRDTSHPCLTSFGVSLSLGQAILLTVFPDPMRAKVVHIANMKEGKAW